MTWRNSLLALCLVLNGCSAIHPHCFILILPPLTGELGTPQPATREQKQRIIAGESAAAVLNEGRVGIGGTLDWSKIALTADLIRRGGRRYLKDIVERFIINSLLCFSDALFIFKR